MGVNIFQVETRLTKDKMLATIKKVSNGYKISTKARRDMGIKDNTKAYLLLGDDNDRVAMKVVTETDDYNATMNKQGIISNVGMVRHLNTIGNNFVFTGDMSDEFHLMTCEDNNNDDTTIESKTNTEYNNQNDNVSRSDARIQADNDATFG